MADEEHYLVEKLQLLGKGSEAQYFRRLDRRLIAEMHRKADEKAREEERLNALFAKLLVAVDLSSCSREALDYAAEIAERLDSSFVVHCAHGLSRHC